MELIKKSLHDPRREYWINAREWTETELSAGSNQILTAIKTGRQVSTQSARQACEFLFALARKALPDIRGNYFWPEAFQEVLHRSNENLHKLMQPKFEKFFRDSIALSFSEDIRKLQSNQIHHKYIAIIFQQAGIGKDRNQILRKFLEFLIYQYSLVPYRNAQEIALLALNDYMETLSGAERSDAQFLSSVLVRLGSEVIILASVLERDPIRVEAVGWSWDQLREFWIIRTGIDLDELTPSASQVLLGLVCKLSTLWLRRDVMRLVRQGKIQVSLPSGISIEKCGGYWDIPITPAEIMLNGRRQLIQIIDRKELNPRYLHSLEKDVWHWLDDEYIYKLSDSPFSVQIPSTGCFTAVPYYCGDKPQNASLLGYFWGGPFPFSLPDSIENPEYEGQSSIAALHISYGFAWRHNRLFLLVNGFRTSIRESDNCTLEIQGFCIWNGGIRKNRPEKVIKKWIDIERLTLTDETKVTLSLSNNSGINSEKKVTIWPIFDGAFLVVRHKLYRSGATLQIWQDDNGTFPEILLFTSEPGVLFHSDDLAATELPAVPIAGKIYSRTTLQITSLGKASVRLGHDIWMIDSRSSVDASYVESGFDVEISSVLISGTGNIRVVRSASELCLRVSDCSVFNEGVVGFWIRTPGLESFCTVDYEDWADGYPKGILSLHGMLRRYGFNVGFGPIELTLGTFESKSSRNYNFFVSPNSIDVEFTRFGEHSRILIGVEDDQLWIKSRDIVTEVIFRECKSVLGSISGQDWDIWFRWKPRIFDWTINGEIGGACDYIYSFSAPSFDLANRQLICEIKSSNVDDLISIRLPDGFVVSPSERLFNLWELLPKSEAWTNLNQVSFSALQGAREIAWTLDLQPVVIKIECEVLQVIERLTEISIGISIYGFMNGDIAVAVISGQETVERRSLTLQKSSMPELSCVSFGSLIPEHILNTLKISVIWNGREIAQQNISPLHNKSVPQASTLRELINSYERTASHEILSAILKESVILVAEKKELMKHVRNVVTQIAGHGNFNDEEWLHVGLKIVELLYEARPRYIWLPLHSPNSPDLAGIVSALWLLISAKYIARGNLNPEHFFRVMNLLASLLDSECFQSDWTTQIAGRVYAFSAGLSSKNGLGETQIRSDLMRSGMLATSFDGPLSSISLEFKNWLETI